jgi:hypothetical protein
LNDESKNVKKNNIGHEELEERPKHTFKNGAVYTGQWLKGEEDIRHGQGTQVWPDGAKYDGLWSNNKANGKGTFWHVHGDKYSGEWLDDKAHGVGTYTHANGARYEGHWQDDL